MCERSGYVQIYKHILLPPEPQWATTAAVWPGPFCGDCGGSLPNRNGPPPPPRGRGAGGGNRLGTYKDKTNPQHIEQKYQHTR